MTGSVRQYLMTGMLITLAGTSVAQINSPIVELITYTNDSLGFKIDLPCDPEWQTPSIPGSRAVLVCATTNPIVIINSERRSIKSNKELDECVKKQVQVGDMPFELTREKIDGHRARRVRLTANGQTVELWVVVADPGRLHLFSFVQPADQLTSAVPGIVASIKLK